MPIYDANVLYGIIQKLQHLTMVPGQQISLTFKLSNFQREIVQTGGNQHIADVIGYNIIFIYNFSFRTACRLQIIDVRMPNMYKITECVTQYM